MCWKYDTMPLMYAFRSYWNEYKATQYSLNRDSQYSKSRVVSLGVRLIAFMKVSGKHEGSAVAVVRGSCAM